MQKKYSSMCRHASTNQNLKAHTFKCYLEAEKKLAMECVFIFSNLISKDALSPGKRQLFNLSNSATDWKFGVKIPEIRGNIFSFNHHYNITSLFSFNAPSFSCIYRVSSQGVYLYICLCVSNGWHGCWQSDTFVKWALNVWMMKKSMVDIWW